MRTMEVLSSDMTKKPQQPQKIDKINENTNATKQDANAIQP